MKKLNLLFTALLFLCCVGTATAQDFEVGGIYYNITDGTNNTVEVTYHNYTGSVVIPESVTYDGATYSVTSIGNDAFYWCSGLTSITIPNSVTSIGKYAFYGCWRLKSITIPNSVTSIGDGAFYSCSGLTSITIPNSVTSIGDEAFYKCTGLTSITIPNSVTSIENSAFGYCSGLTSITIPNSVTSIGDWAFSDCTGLTSITIPNSVTSIGERAFSDCTELTSITIPNSVTNIGDRVFYGCTSLKELRIEDGEGTLSLGCNTYYGDGTGEGLFYYCPLETLYLGRNLSYNASYGYGYSPFYNKKTLTSVTIGNSVTSIESYAFYKCTGLTSIEIPNSVTSIGDAAFLNCTGLTSIVVDGNNTKYDSREDCNAIIETETNTLVSACKNSVIPNSVTSIGSYAFYGCSGLTSIEIPNSVTSIGSYAFYSCTGLTSIVIPNSVTSIGDWAFYNCTGLTNVVIPNSVTSIGYEAFRDCTGLTSVEIPNSVTSIGNYAFEDCTGLTSITSLIPAESLFDINSYVFYNVDKTFCTLYVPVGAKETYASTQGWKDFVNIVEKDFTGIDEVKAENGTNGRRPEGLKAKVKTIYDLNGRAVENPAKGIYIINGKKVLIK